MYRVQILTLLVSLSLCLTSLAADDTNKKSTKVKKSSNNVALSQQPLTMNRDLNTLFNSLEKPLNSCRTSYEIEQLTLQTRLSIAIEKGEDTSKVFDEMEKDGHPYKKCIADSKNVFNSNSQDVMKEIKDENLKTKTRAILAQWLTAIDSVPEKNFQDELTKFKSLRNNFQLEFPSK